MTNTMTVQYKTVNFNLTRTLISTLDSIQQGYVSFTEVRKCLCPCSHVGFCLFTY